MSAEEEEAEYAAAAAAVAACMRCHEQHYAGVQQPEAVGSFEVTHAMAFDPNICETKWFGRLRDEARRFF